MQKGVFRKRVTELPSERAESEGEKRQNVAVSGLYEAVSMVY